MQHQRTTLLLLLACGLLLLTAGPVQAQDLPDTIHPMNRAALEAGPTVGKAMTGGAFIDNGTIQLGVHDEGHLNVRGGPRSLGGTTTVGLRYLPTGAEATAPGCLCEGWGVADVTSGVWGGADEAAGGVTNLIVESATFTASTATSVVRVGSTFRVTHAYRPSPATPYLYEVEVTIENISGAPTDVRYRREMDWDIEPTAFSERVTIVGAAASTEVIQATNDGFESPNPLLFSTPIGAGDASAADIIDYGPLDHGANFTFGFGVLAPGESKTFKTYYGAAGNEADALAALAAVSAEVYSLGQTRTASTPIDGAPNTFIFGFGGVGGTAVCDPIEYENLGLIADRVAGLRLTHPDGIAEVQFTNLVNFTETNTVGGGTESPADTWTFAGTPGLVEFELTAPPSATSATYALRAVSECGSVLVVDPPFDFTETVDAFALDQNYPNPFNPTTQISFTLPEATSVRLAVYDLMGREVKTLVSQTMEAGQHTVTWNGRDAAGQPVASGTYFYRIEAGDFVAMKQMMLLK
ncbi:hypothetical protein AWN76_015030 [Rhodothermaceae bacterium RA]|nr:hypothetical protein AWN76_015030 [Rhodothermaceae bacterium RA]